MFEIIMTLISVFGGLGLFLYGMKQMSDGLENYAGNSLKNILEKITSNRLIAVFVGIVVTSIVQSSSATTVMVVGFVNSGLMTLAQSAGVIMGANIGTTVTAQLLAFKLTDYALLFVAIGSFMFITGKNKSRNLGDIILGFGLLFFGLHVMSGALSPLKELPFFTDIILMVSNRWYLGIFIGLAITVVIQSSSATTGILLALSASGAITIGAAIPILLGTNIGTCITALLASIGTNKTAHKAAYFHLSFNIIGVLLFIPLMGVLQNIVTSISPDNVSRQIANAHTIFNIATTIVLIGFVPQLIKFVDKIVGPDEKIKKDEKYSIDYRILETPVIAVSVVSTETINMAKLVKENFELSMEAFIKGNKESLKKVYANEVIINQMDEVITDFLVKLSNRGLAENQINFVTSSFNVVNDLERVGDHCENIVELAEEKFNKNVSFSSDATEELFKISELTSNILNIAVNSYENKNDEDNALAVKIEEDIDSFEKRIRSSNISRLNKEVCKPNASTIFLDMISNLERIADHSTNILEAVTFKP